MQERDRREDLARELFRAAHPDPMMGCPYHRQIQLTDLFECDQEEYRRMADVIIRKGDQP